MRRSQRLRERQVASDDDRAPDGSLRFHLSRPEVNVRQMPIELPTDEFNELCVLRKTPTDRQDGRVQDRCRSDSDTCNSDRMFVADSSCNRVA
jgi:hypothetical protein